MTRRRSQAGQQAEEVEPHKTERPRSPGVLVFALTPRGEGSLLSGLLDLIERQLFAASTAQSGGLEPAPWTEAAHRLTHAAIEIDRRERAGHDAATRAKGGRVSVASPARLTRKVLRFLAGTIMCLGQIATQASAALGCNVSRSTAAREAIGEWLDAAEQGDPAESLAVIRTAIVRRGRKRATLPPRSAE